MPSPFPSPWRRESRGSTEPRPNSRPSSRDPSRLSYSPAQGTPVLPHVPRATTSRRVAALRERTLASTAASLRVAEHTEFVAGATLRELDAQSESLERTRKNLDDAEKSAEEGERTLDEMRACGVSCFSLRGLFRSSRRTPPDAATPNLAGAESRGDVADARDELSRRAAAKRKTNQTTTTTTTTTTTLRSNETVSSKDDAIGANAVALSFSLDALRRASEAMGEKLDEQTRTVDDVASRSLSLRSKLARAESRGAA